MVIGIIGGGASGMAAALAAAEDSAVQVVIFERQARVGRKLQATGNGRCNLTNLHAHGGSYHGEEPEFAAPALDAMRPEETCQWFERMGLFTVAEASGRVYPYSDQANSVVDVLRLALKKSNITIRTGAEVRKVRRSGEGFAVETGKESVFCHKVIVACGGLAGTKLGGSLSGYKLLSGLGHKSTKLRPALVQLKCGWHGVVALKGVRANCCARMFRDGQLFAQSTGEIQFTEYGLSGPVIFEISRDVCQGEGQWVSRLDFLPDYTPERLKQELLRRRETGLPMDELLTGILHNRLGRVLTKTAGITGKQFVREMNDGDISLICEAVKNFEVILTEPMGMDAAQVTAGGVLTRDFDPETMESRLVPGLFACGEVLDIDGDCGGYNLQWAWSSGYCAGKHAGKGRL